MSPRLQALRVAIYARLSLATEASVSIARQTAACEAYAAERGWRIVLRAVDEGVSARKVRPDQRPGWRSVAERYTEIDRVLYWKTDRVARRVIDFYRLAEETQKHGVALVSATEPMLDLSTPTGKAFAGMLAVFAEFETDQISARIVSARGHILHEGRVAGGERPWPYEVAPRENGPGMVWRPIPERAEAVREATRALIAGEASISGICREWTERGLRPKDGGVRWDTRSVRRLLSNPALYGATVYHGDLIRNHDGSVRISPERVILDRATYRALQGALAIRAANKSTPRVQNLPLLHGIAVCDACSAPLQAHRPTDPSILPRYHCRGRRGCSARVSIALRSLEAYVVTDFLSTFGRLPVTECVEDAPSADPVRVAELEDALDELQARLDATDDDEEALAIVRHRKDLRASLAELQDTAASAAPVVHWVETGESFAEIWYADESTAARRALLARAYGQIRVKKGRPGRHGLETSRLVILPPEAMDGYTPTDAE